MVSTIATMKSRRSCSPPPPTKGRQRPRSRAAREELFAELSKALGHPARVALIRILIKRESCVCGELVDELPLAQSTVSQHLKVLKEAGFVRGEIDGPSVCYCIEPGTLALFQELSAELLAI